MPVRVCDACARAFFIRDDLTVCPHCGTPLDHLPPLARQPAPESRYEQLRHQMEERNAWNQTAHRDQHAPPVVAEGLHPDGHGHLTAPPLKPPPENDAPGVG